MGVTCTNSSAVYRDRSPDVLRRMQRRRVR